MTTSGGDPPRPRFYVSNPDTEEYVSVVESTPSPWQHAVRRLVAVFRRLLEPVRAFWSPD